MQIDSLEIIVPDEAEILDIAQMAQAGHLHLVSDGKQSLLSPIVPKGWKLLMDYRSPKAQQLAKAAA